MSTVLNQLTSAIGALLTMVGNICTKIVSNPILLFLVLFPLIFFVYHVIRSLIKL